MLQTWIQKIPFIFRHEMKAPDFELFISDTNMDFYELKIVFPQGVDKIRCVCSLITNQEIKRFCWKLFYNYRQKKSKFDYTSFRTGKGSA